MHIEQRHAKHVYFSYFLNVMQKCRTNELSKYQTMDMHP